MSKKNIRKETFLFINLILFSLLIFYSSRFPIFKKTRGFLERPILFLQSQTFTLKQKVVLPLRLFGSWRKTEGEKIRLEEEIRGLLVKSGELSACLEENEEMKKLLGAPLPSFWYFIPAKIVGYFQKLKLNVGQKAGVQEGMMVVSENILIGKIESSEDFSSLLILTTDPNIKIPVIVRSQQKSGIKGRGVLAGYATDQMVLTEVLKSEQVGENDLVFTSGEGGWLPDLLVGKIQRVEEGKEKVFKKAWVSPLLDYQNLRLVFVVKVIQQK